MICHNRHPLSEETPRPKLAPFPVRLLYILQNENSLNQHRCFALHEQVEERIQVRVYVN